MKDEFRRPVFCLECQRRSLNSNLVTKNRLHRTFVLWPLRLMAVSLLVILVTAWFVPISTVFIGAGVVLGILHSLSTMEELTGGRELTWISTPVVLAGDAFLTAWSFVGMTLIQNMILFLQFLAVIVVTEAVIVFLLRSKLETFCVKRGMS